MNVPVPSTSPYSTVDSMSSSQLKNKNLVKDGRTDGCLKTNFLLLYSPFLYYLKYSCTVRQDEKSGWQQQFKIRKLLCSKSMNESNRVMKKWSKMKIKNPSYCGIQPISLIVWVWVRVHALYNVVVSTVITVVVVVVVVVISRLEE